MFEQSPPEVDNYIQPSDSKVFGDCLESLEVTRFEIDDPKGSPRSFSIKFGFSENEYFEDKSLEKKFWHRQTNDTNSWEGLVSEPVKINWKKGKDLTDGLTDAAYALYQAKQKVSVAANGKDQAKWTKLPEYKALADKIQNSEEASNSFFTWFGFVSDYRWVSAEESEQASKAYAAKLAKAKAGEKLEEEPEEEDDSYDYQETEVFPLGGELATIIVEDMWPSAIKYYSMSSSLFRYSVLTPLQSVPTRPTSMMRICPTSTLKTWTMRATRRSISAHWWEKAARTRSRMTRRLLRSRGRLELKSKRRCCKIIDIPKA